MILPILRWPDARLSTTCAPAVLSDALQALAEDMLQTMYAAQGRGLAAPQVGRLVRLFVMDIGWKDGARPPVAMVNPEVLRVSDERASGPEGCLSIPGPLTVVERAAEVRLRWTGLDGAAREEDFAGFASVCVQHEIDHLDGILTLDRIGPEARARAEAEVLA